MKLNAETIEKVLDLPSSGEKYQVNGLATDSREVQAGQLFATWQGENFDGCRFCPEAVRRGASALLLDRRIPVDAPQIVVSDPVKALGRLASYWRDQFDLPVVAVTGSNGKTTVKNMLASIFRQMKPSGVLAPKKSYNNHVGVPLTLAQLTDEHSYAVVEMGMNHFGEIAYVSKLAKPTVAIITNAGPSHLAGVGSIAGVAKAKAEIFQGLMPASPVILNADDDYFDYWKSMLPGNPVTSFGIENEAMVTAKNIQMSVLGSQFDLVFLEESIAVELPLLGEHNILNALAAAAAAHTLSVPVESIKKGLENVEPESHRLERKLTALGAALIDDSYNANPNSTRRAIDVIQQFPQKHKYLILGDMRELGDDEKQLHEALGHYAKAAGITAIYCIGDLMKATCLTFGENAHHFSDKASLLKAITPLLKDDAVVLVKGSLSMGMLDFVQALSG